MYLIFYFIVYQFFFFYVSTFLCKELLLGMIHKSVLVTELKANKIICSLGN